MKMFNIISAANKAKTVKLVYHYIKDKLTLLHHFQASDLELINIVLSLKNPSSSWTVHHNQTVVENIKEYFPDIVSPTVFLQAHTNKFLVVASGRLLPVIFQYTPTGGRVSISSVVLNDEAAWLVTILAKLEQRFPNASASIENTQEDLYLGTQPLFNDPFVNKTGAGFNPTIQKKPKAFFELDAD